MNGLLYRAHVPAIPPSRSTHTNHSSERHVTPVALAHSARARRGDRHGVMFLLQEPCQLNGHTHGVTARISIVLKNTLLYQFLD